MNEADEFINAFIKGNPEAESGKLTLDELNERLAKFQNSQNSRPLQEFDGLNPLQMNELLYSPFSDDCPLQLSQSCEEFIDKVPLYQLAELLLSEIQKSGGIKLTTKGNLPVGICELLVKQDLIKWKYMRYLTVIREDDIPYLWPLKQYLLDLSFVKKLHNKLSLTKKGKDFMKESKEKRLVTVLLYFGRFFNWGNFYNLQDGGRAGQLGWAYSLWLLHKYGNESRESEFYSSKLIKAFEKDLENKGGDVAQKRITDYHDAYAYRFFENFANWFGLVTIERRKVHNQFSDQLIILKTELCNKLFYSTV